MSVESKIRELMTGKLNEAAFPGAGKNMESSAPAQGSSQHPPVELMHKGFSGQSAPSTASKTLMASGGPKEAAPMKQGSSQDAKIDSQDDQETQGKTQAKKAKKMPELRQNGAGQAPNFSQVADPTSVINQPNSKGNVYREDVESDDEEIITEEELENMSDEEFEELLSGLSEEELENLLSEDLDDENDDEEFISEEEFEQLSDEEKEMFEPVEFDMDDMELTDEEIEALLSGMSEEEISEILDEAIIAVKRDGKSALENVDLSGRGHKSLWKPGAKYNARTGVEVSDAPKAKSRAQARAAEKPVASGTPEHTAAMSAVKKELEKHTSEKQIKSMKRKEKAGIKEEKNFSFQVTEEIRTLFADQTDLSEEFMNKASSLFEAIVVAKVTEIREELEAEAAEMAAEFIENYLDDMVEHVDGYLGYVTEQWMKENEVAVTSSLRSEITEDFIAGLKVLFKESYVDVPDEKYDLIGELEDNINELHGTIEEMNENVNAALNENIELRQALINAKKDNIVLEHAFDLTMADTEKLRSLVEDVDFENEDMFSEKVHAIKKNFFAAQEVKEEQTTIFEDEHSGVLNEEISPSMQVYTKVLSRGSSV